MERMVYPGEFYRHFKNRLYQVIVVAVHSETGERMVVYQALYGNFSVYVRPYEMFVSEVDHEKYPEVRQRYRFERVTPGVGPGAAGRAAASGVWRSAESGMAGVEEWTSAVSSGAGPRSEQTTDISVADDGVCAVEEREPNPALLRFLDTDDYEEQIACLKQLEKSASQSDLDSIYVVLDMKPADGDIAVQLSAVARYLSLRDHFDGRRLR